MKIINKLIFPSLLIIPFMFGIIFIDLVGTFFFSDVPFALVLALYLIFVLIQRAKSRTTFVFVLFFIIWMGLSYIPTGAGQTTERVGEWFYLFFVFGLIQYAIESWKK